MPAKPAQKPDEKLLDPNSVDDVTNFDLDAWLDDAKLPQRSVTVYGRADLLAELDRLEAEMRLAEADEEGSVASTRSVEGLQARWDEVAEQIEASKLTVTVRAMVDGDVESAREAVEDEGLTTKDGNAYVEALGQHILSRVIVSPSMTVDQVRKIESKIGQPQMQRIVDAYGQAGDATRVASPPFSRRSSQGRRGGTSQNRSARRARGASPR